MAIYYVVHNGPQGNGSGDSPTNGMSLQGALDAVTAGNEIRVCATGAYSFSAQVDADTNSGTDSNPIRVLGYSADGLTPQRVTLTWTAGAVGIYVTKSYVHLADLYVARSGAVGGTGVQFTTGSSNCLAVRVKASGWALGMYVVNSGSSMLQDCEVSGNTDGIRLVANYTCAIGCIAHDNTDDGFAQCGDYMVYCLSYGNGGVGFELDCTAFSGAKLINCTALRNGSDGIYINRDGDARALILNCISARNGPTAYGLNASAPTICVGGANLIPASGADANTSGAINNVTFVDSVAVNLATSATANFVNPADGEENLALQSGSAAKGAGWPGAMLIGGTGYMDIGALQRAEPTLPTEAQVEDGVQYGDGGTQYEGQLVAGGGADLPDCIMVGI